MEHDSLSHTSIGFYQQIQINTMALFVAHRTSNILARSIIYHFLLIYVYIHTKNYTRSVAIIHMYTYISYIYQEIIILSLGQQSKYQDEIY